MNLTVILLTAGFLNVCARGVSQNVTFSGKDVSLESVFYSVRQQTGFVFLYKESVLKSSKPVSISAENVPVEKFLKKIFESQPLLKYNIKGKSVFISSRPPVAGSSDRQALDGAFDFLKDTLINVKGQVMDEKGLPLAGASVKVKDGNNGAMTDDNGNFQLKNIRNNDVLIVSYTGYTSEEIFVGRQTVIRIVLKDAIKNLDQVIVVGFGTQKKINLTGAVSQIDGKVLDNRPVANVGQSLQGIIPNLNLTTTGDPGGPGTNASYNIRGNTSINGGGPLFIVDGIPVDNINDINLADIASISVLKDAAASAIYGARAPYGVILVTTKRGKKGEKTTITYSTMIGENSYTRLPKMANSVEFAQGLNQASLNSGQSAPFSADQIEKLKANIAHPGTFPVAIPDPNNSSQWDYATPLNADNVDWFQAFFKKWSYGQKHDLSLSGGSGNTTYYLGIGYYDQGGQLRYGDEDFQRYNLTGNIHTEATKWLRLDFRTRFSRRKTDIPYEYADQLGNWVHSATTRWPNWALRNPDGYFSDASNLNLLANGGRHINSENDITLTGSLEAEPVKDWKINLDYSYNNRSLRDQYHSAFVYAYGPNGNKYNVGPSQNSVGEGNFTYGYNSFNLYSSYEKQSGKHYFKVLVGQQTEVYNHFDVHGTRADLITDDLPAIGVATGTQNVYDGISEWATMGSFARINYNYEQKFLLEVNGRYDGTSKFPDGNRFGFFPSVSAGYNLAMEKYWDRLKNDVNMFKVRASYGSLGNQNVANYLYLATIDIGSNLDYILNGTRPNFIGTPGLISSSLSWETSRTVDVGLDAAFLNNRLSLTYDWYMRNTLNMLGPASVLPSTLGASVPFQNNANLQTRGFELTLTWRDRIGQGFNYNVSFVLSDYLSKIKRYYNPTYLLDGPQYTGKTLDEIWGYETAGLIQTDHDLETMPDQSYIFGEWTKGDVMYKDLNNDKKIDPGKNTLADHGDLKVIGNSTPRYSYGVNLGLDWNGLNFSMFLQGVAKRELWLGGGGSNSGNIFWGFTPGFGNNVYKTTLNYWTPDRTGAYWPKPYVSSEANKNHEVQSGYLQSGAYMRVKNIQIGYDLNRLIKHTPLQKIRIFLSGENLLTFSKINKNYDPEVVDGSWGSGKIYPLIKTISVGANITL